MGSRRHKVAWALVLALCTQVPEGAKAQQQCTTTVPSIDSKVDKQIANKHVTPSGLCLYHQQRVIEVYPQDVGNKQQFVFTKDLESGNRENYFMGSNWHI